MSEIDGISSGILDAKCACMLRSGCCLCKQVVAIYSREGAEITATLSVKFLCAKPGDSAVKTISKSAVSK